MNDNDALNDRLMSALDVPIPPTPAPPAPPAQSEQIQLDVTQWQVRAKNAYVPSGPTIERLPSGNYWTMHDDDIGPFLQRRAIITDGIVTIPDSASASVLAVMEKFWNSQARYKQFGLLFKRGILLWGPPGSGKSITVRQLSQQVINRDGIVIHCTNPELAQALLQRIRAIEPTRPIIVIYEDIDELIHHCGEHALLAMLDGETQIDNIVHIATTNYPERLGARIVNRPSRFDDRVFVGMPNLEQRLCYLTHLAPTADNVTTWAEDTEGLSIAHLRELVVAVYCLEADYNTTLERLQAMNERPTEVDGFALQTTAGFAPQVIAKRRKK